jgi:hypothetical protein
MQALNIGNMKQHIVLLSLLTLIIFRCSEHQSPTKSDDQPEFGSGDEYDVYYTVLINSNKYSQKYVIADSSVVWDVSHSIDYLKESMPALEDETLNNFILINKAQVKLKNIPRTDDWCFLIAYDNARNWDDIYPAADALLHVSRVGFNSQKDQALVYISFYYAPLAGSGNLILLEKDSGWVIRQSLMLWIS